MTTLALMYLKDPEIVLRVVRVSDDPIAEGHIKVRNDGTLPRYIHRDLKDTEFCKNYPRE